VRGSRNVEMCVRLEVCLATGLARKLRINPHPESVSVSVGGWVGEWCILYCKWMKRPRKTWMEGVRSAMKTRHLEGDQWLNR